MKAVVWKTKHEHELKIRRLDSYFIWLIFFTVSGKIATSKFNPVPKLIEFKVRVIMGKVVAKLSL